MLEDTQVINIETFGRNLQKLRRKKKLSLETLANLADIDLSGLSRIELGKTNPKLSTIFALAKALEIPPAQLFIGQSDLSEKLQ